MVVGSSAYCPAAEPAPRCLWSQGPIVLCDSDELDLLWPAACETQNASSEMTGWRRVIEVVGTQSAAQFPMDQKAHPWKGCEVR